MAIKISEKIEGYFKSYDEKLGLYYSQIKFFQSELSKVNMEKDSESAEYKKYLKEQIGFFESKIKELQKEKNNFKKS